MRRTIPSKRRTTSGSNFGMHTGEGTKNDYQQQHGNENTETYGGQLCKPATEHNKASHAKRHNRPAASRGSGGSSAKQLQHTRCDEESRRETACREAPVIVAELHFCAKVSSRYALSFEESHRGTSCRDAPLIAAEMQVCAQVLSSNAYNVKKALAELRAHRLFSFSRKCVYVPTYYLVTPSLSRKAVEKMRVKYPHLPYCRGNGCHSEVCLRYACYIENGRLSKNLHTEQEG